MMVVVGDRVKFIAKGISYRSWHKQAKGSEGTIVNITGQEFWIEWDCGEGPNGYLNPDKWPKDYLSTEYGQHYFAKADPPFVDWSDTLELQ